MKRKKIIAEKIADELQMPLNAVSDVFKIELLGKNNITIEGCKGIVEYDDSAVAVNLGGTVAKFTGCDLEISNFFESTATIRGDIITLEFS